MIIMKGLELPISTTVILVIALVILLAVLTLFFNIWTPGAGGVTLQAATTNACQMLVSTGCRNPDSVLISDFDANKDGTMEEGTNWNWGGYIAVPSSYCGSTATLSKDNLAALCACHYHKDETECKTNICNCP